MSPVKSLVLADRLPVQPAGSDAPRSVAIAEQGVTTGVEFATLMSALMADVITGRLAPDAASAAVRAGGKLLKVVEMQYRYARPK